MLKHKRLFFWPLVFPILLGLSLNSEKAGGVSDIDDVKSSVETSIETAQPYDSGVLKNDHTGNFGNP